MPDVAVMITDSVAETVRVSIENSWDWLGDWIWNDDEGKTTDWLLLESSIGNPVEGGGPFIATVPVRDWPPVTAD